MTATHHIPRLVPPPFALPGDGSTLHQCVGQDFVSRFLSDAQAGRLVGTQAQDWYTQDRFGRHVDAPSLRLPMHRSFYLVCSEVVCDTAGQPAFDPRKVVSAGLVVRRKPASGSVQRWMLVHGRPVGWQGGEPPAHDPDDVRRLTRRGLLPRRFPEPPTSGEDTTPLHTLTVRRRGPDGRERTHTLLWGYLALGGSAPGPEEAVRVTGVGAADTPDTGEEPDFNLEHAWPLGSRGARPWTDDDGRLVTDGRPRPAFVAWVQTLVQRFRIHRPEVGNGSGGGTSSDNEALRSWLSQVRFHHLEARVPPGAFLPVLAEVPGERLIDWLDRVGDALVLRPDHPDAARTDHLAITEQQAADLRTLMQWRTARAVAHQDGGLPQPRYGQTGDDRFEATPFIRWRDDCGCEQVAWGPPTRPFRVASPLDPEAQRPTTIVLPGLDDLRRGAARGVTLLAPKSLADVLRRISPELPLKEGGPGNPVGACFSFSFSLPAITLCAMVLLMVMVSLLNLFFFWLPSVFLALPRRCLQALRNP